MRPLALAPRRLGPFTLARGDGYAVVGYFPRATRFDPRRGHLLYSGDSHWTRGPVYQTLTNRLREALGRHVRERYGAEVQIVLSRPPTLEMGEAASPVCFELAKQLKRPPRQIAQEIAANFATGSCRRRILERVLRPRRLLGKRTKRSEWEASGAPGGSEKNHRRAHQH